MKRPGQKWIWFLMWVALVAALLADVRWGSVSLDWNRWWQAFTGSGGDVNVAILWQYRIPKALTAWAVGAGLGLAGLLMQTMFRNPIAGPYVLGISSGAGLSVGLWMLAGALAGFRLGGGWDLALVAAAGSTGILLLDLWLYYRTRSAVTLLIAGLMTGIFSGALLSLLQFGAPARDLQKYVFWSMGNLGHLEKSQIVLLWVLVAASYAVVWMWRRRLDLLLLGDDYVSASGYPVFALHRFIVVVAGLLAGVITAFAGPIAFVGLMVPHVVYLVTGSRLHAVVVPAVFLTGGFLMLAADLISQWPGNEGVLPVNSITSLLGAPLVVWLMLKQKH